MGLPGQLRGRLQDRRTAAPADQKEDPEFLKKTDKNFNVVFDTLKKYKTKDGGFVSYEKLTDLDRKVLSARVNTLAEDLSHLRGMLGLN